MAAAPSNPKKKSISDYLDSLLGGRAVRIRKRLPRSSVKFFVFGVVCLVLLALLGIKIGNLSFFTSRHTYYAQLADVTGLNAGDPVDIAGRARSARSRAIQVQRAHALVGDERQLAAQAALVLRRRDAVAQRDRPEGRLPLPERARRRCSSPAPTIPLSHDVSDASVNALLELARAVPPVHQPDRGQRLRAQRVGGDRGRHRPDRPAPQQRRDGAKTVGDLNTQVGAIIANLDQVMTAIATAAATSARWSRTSTRCRSPSPRTTRCSTTWWGTSRRSRATSPACSAPTSPTSSQTIRSLNTVLSTLNQNQQSLSEGLSGLGEGLAPYTEISAWGQWFQIQTVYTCLANETACSYYQPTNPPPGSGPGGCPERQLTVVAALPSRRSPRRRRAPRASPTCSARSAAPRSPTIDERAMKAFTDRNPRRVGRWSRSP